MAITEEHERDCKALLGEKWRNAHVLLDQYASVFPPNLFGEYHRTFLHNKYGLCIIKEVLGERAVLAGKIHLVRDWYGIPLTDKPLDWVLANFPRAMLYFHNVDRFEPKVHPNIAKAWRTSGLSLCEIAFGGCHAADERKEDKFHPSRY